MSFQDLTGAGIGHTTAIGPAAGCTVYPLDDVVTHVQWVRIFGQHIHRKSVLKSRGFKGVLPPGSALWFTRAAFTAAEIFESRKKWDDAIRIYERVVESEVAAAAEARLRIERLRKQRWANPG